MAYLREIITEGHPTLRKVAKRVAPAKLPTRSSSSSSTICSRRCTTPPGIGLAAPQVNVSKRIFTVDLQDDDPQHGPLVVINPKFTLTEGEIEATEGCLSVPGMVGEMMRFEHVVCAGLDRHGKKIELDGVGLFARCLQHEMDHLDGMLYIDKAQNIRPAETDEERAEAEAALTR